MEGEFSEEVPGEENDRFENKRADSSNKDDVIPWLWSFFDVSIFATIWNAIFGCGSKKKRRRKLRRKHHTDSGIGEFFLGHSI